MSKYEIPLNSEKTFQYRFFEILPGVLSWTALALPFVLAFVSVTTAAVIMIAYLMLWFVKAVVLNLRAVQGYRLLQEHQELIANTLQNKGTILICGSLAMEKGVKNALEEIGSKLLQSDLTEFKEQIKSDCY